MTTADLPHLNASLNGLATVLLVIGFVMIRQRRVAAHRACMLSATAVSAAFLVSYLIYHYAAGHVKFEGAGTVRLIYLFILFSHIALAAVTPILVMMTIYRALRGQLARHRALARWTLPIWLYVSVTGVVVYWMLYRMEWGA